MATNRDRIISLDIETTGLQPTDHIWSVGIATQATRKKDREIFLSGITQSKSKSKAIDDLFNLHSNSFGLSQLESGAFEAFGKAAESSKTASFNSAIKDLSDMAAQADVMLIQNVNFEDRFLSSQITPKAKQMLTDKLYFDTPSSRRRLFQESASVENARALTMASGETLRQSLKDGSDVDSYIVKHSQASQELMSTISQTITDAKSAGKIAVVDLLDITRSTYAVAAEKGLVNPQHIGMLSNMDFITRGLLGRPETHRALMDGQDQIHAYNIFKDGYDELLKTGKFTPELQKLADSVDSGFHEINYNFLKSVRSHIEDIGAKDKPTNVKDAVTKVLGRTDQIDEGLNGFGRESYATSLFGKDKPEALAQVNADLKLIQNGEHQAVIDQHAYAAAAAKKESKLTTKGKIGLGVAAVVGLGIVSTLGDTSRREQKHNTYNELYDEQYVGTALADWQDRNKSHRMS
jgi:hypothetical protein